MCPLILVRPAVRAVFMALALALSLSAPCFAIAFFDGPRTHESTLFSSRYSVLDGVVEVTSGAGGCSGSLIADRIVLTAGHCFDGNHDGISDQTSAMVRFNKAGSFDAFEDINGTPITAPGFGPSSAVGNTDNNDVAVVVLDTSAPGFAQRYNFLTGPLDARTLNKLQTFVGNVSLVGYGNYFEEGQLVAGFGDRKLGFNTVDGVHTINGGLISAFLNFGEGITVRGDSGGPLLFWENGFGIGVPLIAGVTSFGRDTGRNGSFADLGDQAFWTYTGGFASFLYNVAGSIGDAVNGYAPAYFKPTNCPPGFFCKPELDALQEPEYAPLEDGEYARIAPSPVPVPASGVLLAASVGMLVGAFRRKR